MIYILKKQVMEVSQATQLSHVYIVIQRRDIVRVGSHFLVGELLRDVFPTPVSTKATIYIYIQSTLYKNEKVKNIPGLLLELLTGSVGDLLVGAAQLVRVDVAATDLLLELVKT